MGTGFHSQATHMLEAHSLGMSEPHTEWEGNAFSAQLREYPESPPKTLVGLVLVSFYSVCMLLAGSQVRIFVTHGSFRLRIKLSQRLCQYLASPPSLYL